MKLKTKAYLNHELELSNEWYRCRKEMSVDLEIDWNDSIGEDQYTCIVLALDEVVRLRDHLSALIAEVAR
tara:strand:- start:740 stop:949 length:210 start_codon:yes stop_codon:yes gene_type:complete